MRICYLCGEEKTKIVFRVFRVYRVNEKCPKYPIYPKYPRYIFGERSVNILSGIGVVTVLLLDKQGVGIT